MKTGRTLMQLAEELERQQTQKRDFIAPASKLRAELSPSGVVHLAVEDFGSHAIAPYAHGQLASFCDIPKIYHDRLLLEDKPLLVENVNRRLDYHGTKDRTVRTLDGNVRALLSGRYRPLDNFDLMEAILPKLLDTPGLSIQSCEVTPTKLYIKAVTDRVQYDLGLGEVVQAGIVISNSEIGAGSVRIEPLLYYLACLNGMIATDSSLKKYHVGRSVGTGSNAFELFQDETRQIADKAFWMKVRDVVAGSFDQINFEKMVKRVDETRQNKIEGDPVKVIEVTAKKFGLNDNEKTGVLTQFLQRGEFSQFGVQASITRHSQDVEDYDRATELERVGGKVIELSKMDWSAIASATA